MYADRGNTFVYVDSSVKISLPLNHLQHPFTSILAFTLQTVTPNIPFGVTTPDGRTLSSSTYPCSFVDPPPPLHADPGGIKDAHQSQHSLQDDSDDIGGHAQGADLRQCFGLDVSHCTLCLIYQRLQGRNNKETQRWRRDQYLQGCQVWRGEG